MTTRAARAVMLPTSFLQLGERAALHAEAVDAFVVTLHNDSAAAPRLSRLLPELTYQMEQLDLQLLKLLDATKDKASVARLVRAEASGGRSFKLRARSDPDNDENDGGNASFGKRSRARPRGQEPRKVRGRGREGEEGEEGVA